MQVFTVNDNYSIVCRASDTRNGFKHTATLLRNGQETGISVKICYLNRTWEQYTYESVLKKVLEKAKLLDENDKDDLIKLIERGR